MYFRHWDNSVGPNTIRLYSYPWALAVKHHNETKNCGTKSSKNCYLQQLSETHSCGYLQKWALPSEVLIFDFLIVSTKKYWTTGPV